MPPPTPSKIELIIFFLFFLKITLNAKLQKRYRYQKCRRKKNIVFLLQTEDSFFLYCHFKDRTFVKHPVNQGPAKL